MTRHDSQVLGGTPLRRLMHRWFVEYNPLYLASACLVLGGTILVSRGLVTGDVLGGLAVAGIAEVYALALVFAAALLLRIGQRRSAVMLSLLTVVYQSDVTLHTETCRNLGAIGMMASAAWLVFFVGKIAALVWAMRLRLSRAAIATVGLGGLGLAVLPYVLEGRPALLVAWIFALVTLQRFARVESKVELDAWQKSVLRRSLRATWIVWSVLGLLHVAFWTTQYHVPIASLAVVAPLLVLRAVSSERRTWLVAGVTLAGAALVAPAAFSATALVAAGALALRAFFPPPARVLVPAEAESAPYRASAADDAPRMSIVAELVPMDDLAVKRRLLAGAAFALYLAVWTSAWTGGAWPAHVVPLDVVLTLGAVAGAVRARLRASIAPVLAVWGHALSRAGLVPIPRSFVEWGAASIGLGFVLLAVSVGAGYALRTRADRS